MKITFITNYLTHHQLPFTEEMYRLLGEDFRFIATNSMEEERIQMGWGLRPEDYPYTLFLDDEMEYCNHLLRESDIVICGGTHEIYIRERLNAGKITLRYFERLYKKGRLGAFTPRGYMRKWKEHTAYRNQPVYLLCAGAYVAGDFNLFFSYPGKKLKWGYFPSFYTYCWEELEEKKKHKLDRIEILWTGRMLHWKHAKNAVRAIRLLLEGPQGAEWSKKIHLTMIGDGECADTIREMVSGNVLGNQKLSDFITLKGFMKPAEIRTLMEQSDIYLMTSDQEEGWGAVVNEAMNSGCAVIAAKEAGSVPYLLKHKENGLIYSSGNMKELVTDLEYLLSHPGEIRRLGKNAYESIEAEWNPGVAAERMVRFCEKLLQGEFQPENSGPLSRA